MKEAAGEAWGAAWVGMMAARPLPMKGGYPL